MHVDKVTGEILDEPTEGSIWLPDEESPPEEGEATSEDWVPGYLCKKLLHVEAERKALKEQFATLNAQLDARERFLHWKYDDRAKAWTEFATAGTEKKSLDTPYGRVGFRKARPKLDVEDKAAALAWAKANAPAAVAVKLTESLRKSELPQDGSVPGTALVPGGDKFYVRPAK